MFDRVDEYVAGNRDAAREGLAVYLGRRLERISRALGGGSLAGEDPRELALEAAELRDYLAWVRRAA